jgi:Rap1a immunity proteins
MWRILLVFIAISETVCSSEAQDQKISGSSLLEACRQAANGAALTSDSSPKVGMCLGELDALNWIMPGIYHEKDRSCLPDDVTRQQLAKVVVAYLDRNRDRLSEPFQGLALEALAKFWPCPPERGWFERWFKQE